MPWPALSTASPISQEYSRGKGPQFKDLKIIRYDEPPVGVTDEEYGCEEAAMGKTHRWYEVKKKFIKFLIQEVFLLPLILVLVMYHPL